MTVSVKPWKNGKYRVNVYFTWPDGSKHRERKYESFASESKARKWGELREAELRAGPKPTTVSRSKTPKVSAVAEEWMVALAGDPESKRSGRDAIESAWRIHLAPFVGDLHLDEVTNAVITDLRTRYTNGGYQYDGPWGRIRTVKPTRSKKTHNNRFTVLRSMLVWAVEQGKIAILPCVINVPAVKPGKAKHHKGPTLDRLLEGALSISVTAYVVFLLGSDAGLRRGEIIALRWQDVDLHAATVTVAQNVYWSKGVAYVDTPKGEDVVTLPMTPRLLAAVKKLRKESKDVLVVSHEGGMMTPKILKRLIMKVEEAADMTPTGAAHILRHSFITAAANAGVTPFTLMQLARHSTLAVTNRYLHGDEDAMRAGIDMLAKTHGGRGRRQPVAKPRVNRRG